MKEMDSTREMLRDRKALEPRQALQSNVRDALEHTITFHEALRARLGEWRRKVRDEKATLFLEHLVEVEGRRIEALREYESVAPEEVLDTWLKVRPEIEAQSWLDQVEMNPRVSAQDISEIVGGLFDLLLKVLDMQSTQTEVEAVQEFLRQLYDDEKRTKLYAIRSTELQ